MKELYDPLAVLLEGASGMPGIRAAAIRILTALLLSALIGWERSSKRHSAGLRTFMLVALGGCGVMLLDCRRNFENGGDSYLLSAAAVIAIGVICIHSVFYSSRNQIKGLTTAVGLWVSGIIGMMVGNGWYLAAMISSVGLLGTLSWMPALETYLKNRSNHFEIHLELTNSVSLQNFTATIRELGLRIDDIEQNPAYLGSGLSVYSIAISIGNEQLKKYKTHKEIIEALKTLDYIYYIEEMIG